MYLRTTKRKNRDGSVVEYYQLAHNVRHSETGNPVAEIIHNFGRADELDRDDLVRLCRSIARVCGVEVRDPLESPQGPATPDGEQYRALPEEVKLVQTLQFGVPYVVEALWEQLKLGTTLRKVTEETGGSPVHERALLAMTANRLCEPDSKLGVWDRWLKSVYMPSCSALKLYQMYEAMDLLHWNTAEVENAVFFHTANLFNLVVDVIFYDTTTASFSVDEEDEDSETGPGFRKYGHSKDGTWSPQIVVALAVTREGLPVRSWVFPGNTADVDTVKKVREDLRGWKLGRALFVADSGNNSRTNRDELARACGKYLLATRMASVSEIKEDVLARRGRFKTIAKTSRLGKWSWEMECSSAGISSATIPVRPKGSESIGNRLSKNLRMKSKAIRTVRLLPDGRLTFWHPAGTNVTLQSISRAASGSTAGPSSRHRSSMENGCCRPTTIPSRSRTQPLVIRGSL